MIDVQKIVEQAYREGIKFGREMESSENPELLLPIAINAAIKIRVSEILNESQIERILKERNESNHT